MITGLQMQSDRDDEYGPFFVTENPIVGLCHIVSIVFHHSFCKNWFKVTYVDGDVHLVNPDHVTVVHINQGG